VTVTATRSARPIFTTPHPVAIVDSATIRQSLGQNAADLLRGSPGIDVIGVGPNQHRIQIRGQRGQRILILEDGIRLNNSRRQQDFGEIPALVGTNELQKIEVVRGPASVLYGSDAIGGVMNMVTNRAPYGRSGQTLNGHLSYRYSGAGALSQISGSLVGHLGRFGYRAGGQYRDAEPFTAPKGSFGNISLDEGVTVHDSGVQDQNYHAEIGYGHSPASRIFLRYTRYESRDAGFGYVEPEAIGDTSGNRVRLWYPEQQVDRFSLGYSHTRLGLPVADKVDVTAYTLLNRRDFSRSIVVRLSPTAQLASEGQTLTDSRTTGLRLEAARAVGRHLLTYGADFFTERSDNTDSSRTVVTGFGPPRTTINTQPSVPHATYRSVGVFLQGELHLSERVNLVLGTRYQDVTARTRETPGLDAALISSGDNALVGSANLAVMVSEHLTLVGTAGRAFRSPNLIERFFDGATSDGSGFQRPNPGLVPETSLNFDAGFKFQRGVFYTETFVFRNEIRDGIRIENTGERHQGRPIFRNVNVDRLRETGLEFLADLRLGSGVALGGTFTTTDSENLSDPEIPVGDSFSSRVTGYLMYRHPAGRFYAGYEVRHNGERKDVDLGGANPIGDVLPSFTVSNLRGGARVFVAGGTTHRVDLVIGNLFNALYAEFPNAGFFRPEPGRHVAVSWSVGF
jgi:outer membrane receptor protein involved in Fe transport